MPGAQPRKPGRKPARKPAARKVSAPTVRKLAQAHTEVAVQALAEIATKGNSEASRISAAMALLDRGYGKSGASATGDGSARAPTLYRRIELIDGIDDHADREHSTERQPGADRQG